MVHTLADALRANFLGNSPQWYKLTIVGFLILNPILVIYDPYVAGWVLVLEFIFTLAMALKCYPLQPGGLLAIEAILLGLATPELVFHEAEKNFPVIMLLMFMVAGIYFRVPGRPDSDGGHHHGRGGLLWHLSQGRVGAVIRP